MRFELTDAPAADDLDTVIRNLGAFNEVDAGPSNRRALAIFVHDEDGTIVGGLDGFTAWGWLFTQRLWVSEALRGRGVAGRLLQMAEAEALARGCHGAWIDTFNPVGLKVYRRAGYEVFGELPEFPVGRTRSFLQKSLRRA